MASAQDIRNLHGRSGDATATPTVNSGSNVLVTAAGRRTSLVRAFVDASAERGGLTYAADVDALAPSLFLAEGAVRLSPSNDPRYVDRLLEIVAGLRIRLLVPTIDPDLPILSGSRQRLEEAGCMVAVSNEAFVSITADKLATVTAFRSHGVDVPATWLPGTDRSELPERVFLKPSRGSASKDTYVVDRSDLDRLLPMIDGPILQEVLDGPEITIDALLDFGGRPIHFVPRRRIRTLAGESIQGVTLEHDVEFEAWITALLHLCGELGAAGPLTLQAFQTGRGPVLSEINARFGGGFPLGLAAGGLYPAWLLDLAAGIEVPSRLGEYEPGLYMTRHHVEILIRSPKW
jgi:carbamoyl-phosphate synthase large subunit